MTHKKCEDCEGCNKTNQIEIIFWGALLLICSLFIALKHGSVVLSLLSFLGGVACISLSIFSGESNDKEDE